MDKQGLWEKCVAFHGHSCGGLMIGYHAALYAMELLGLGFSEDEEVVCVCETDACGVDAIQAVLGCTLGKGNLLFRMRGKQAFSFFSRKDGGAVRLVLRPRPPMDKAEAFTYLSQRAPADLFDVKKPGYALPERARLMDSLVCEACGEVAADAMMRLADGKTLCLDCVRPYSRFAVED